MSLRKKTYVVLDDMHNDVSGHCTSLAAAIESLNEIQEYDYDDKSVMTVYELIPVATYKREAKWVKLT